MGLIQICYSFIPLKSFVTKYGVIPTRQLANEFTHIVYD